jgi:hypothetical protein
MLWRRCLAPVLVLVTAVAPAAAGQGATSARLRPRPVPFTLTTNGERPSLIVDEVGTAHVVWNEPVSNGADVLHYCEVPRGARKCVHAQAFIPPDGEAQFNTDSAGPQILQLGPDQYELLTSRYPNVVTVQTSNGAVAPNCFSDHPDDSATACFGSSTKIWRYRSDNGGASFGDPHVLSHGDPMTGGATVLRFQDAPRVAVITDTTTGGTFFQQTGPDGWTKDVANVGDQGRDRAYSGSVASLPDGRPATAFTDLAPRTYFRIYGGSGYMNDIRNWRPTQDLGSGDDPRLASGPNGMFLMNRVRSLLGQQRYLVRRYGSSGFSSPVTVSPVGQVVNRDIYEDSGGNLHVAWVRRSSNQDFLEYRRSDDRGRTWSSTDTLVRAAGSSVWNVHLAAADDGGGFAVWSRTLSGAGAIQMTTFGPQAPLYDVHPTAIEVTQGIQVTDLPVRSRDRPDAPVAYAGVKLRQDAKTVVRVYANSKTRLPPEGLPIKRGFGPGVPMLLHVYHGSRELVGSPLQPEAGPKTLATGSMFDVSNAERASPRGAYTFTIPWTWTREGPLTFKAELNPAGLNPAVNECRYCVSNNSFTLYGVQFRKTGHVSILPVAVKVNGSLPVGYYDDTQIFALAKSVTPLDFYIYPYMGELDASKIANIVSYTVEKCFLGVFPCSSDTVTDPNKVFALKLNQGLDMLRSWADRGGLTGSDRYIVGVFDQGFGGGVTNGGGLLYTTQPFSLVQDTRPLTSVAHELGHALGRVHAGLQCGGNSSGQVGEAWWDPGNWGWLDGFGLNLTGPSPYLPIDPANSPAKDSPSTPQDETHWYDLMSYCADLQDLRSTNNAWTSVLNWNREIDFHATAAAAARAQAAPRRARGTAPANTLEVSAAVIGDTVHVTQVRHVQASPTAGTPGSRYRLVARSANGTVLATAGVAESFEHVDGPGSYVRLTGRVNATGADAVDIVRDGATVGEKLRSAHPPVVKITSPHARARVGGSRNVVVSWTATDADHDALSSSLDYSRDGGRHWRPLFVGAAATRATLPPLLFARSRNARVRVVVNDGFNETVAVSAPFTSLGAPPYVRITTPRSGERIAAGAGVPLEGNAVDAEGNAVRKLVWLDGRRRLGQGPRITATGLTPGHHTIRLTARGDGRVGTAKVKVFVAAVQPYFLRLTAPRRVSRRARHVTLRVKTNVPATLRVGSRRFPVGARLRRIVVPIRAGAGQLRVSLVLRSGGLITRTFVVVSRR